MDSIVSAALSEICSQGVNGISLAELWPTLHNSLSSAGLNICDGVKRAIWNRVLNIPGLQFEANKSSFGSQDPSIQSFEEAEKLGLKIIAAENLRDSFVGLYDLKAADAGISPPQRRALERLASARSDGITQSQLAKEFGMKGNNIFYVVRNLEVQGLIVRQSTIVRTKEASTEGESSSKNTSIVNTNLIHLYRYAKHLNSQQRLEITKTDTLESLMSADGSTSIGDGVAGDHVKDDVLVKDYLPALKAVCDKLEEADGKVLVVSDIKQAFGYRRTPGHRAWRNLCNRLKDARLVEEFPAEVNRKVVSCLRLLKKFDEKHFLPKPVPCGSDDVDTDQPLRCGNRGQITEQLLELPIEHQIHDMIAAEGTKGLTVTEVCKRLGLNNKRNYSRLLNMFSRFGCHLQAESHNRSVLYRVWTSGNFTGGSSIAPPGKSADVVDEDEQSKQCVMDLVLHDKADAAMLQLDSLTSKEEFATPGKMESGRMGLELASSPHGNGESKQVLTYQKKERKQILICGSNNPQDLVGESGDAELDLVRIESNVVPSETPSPPLSNPSRIRSYPRYPCLTLTPASAQREQRILERLQEEKFILTVELYRWLESLEKDKPTTMAKKTLTRTLNKLQHEGHCKCVHISVPVVTNCGSSRTTEVVLHKSIQTLAPGLLGQIHERLRSFDMQSRGQGLSRLKNEKSVPVLTDIKRIFSCESSDSQAVRAEAMRANGFVTAKMVRAKLLHNFLWCYLSSSPDWDDALSSGRHGYDLKNPHSTCKLFALNVAIKAMPLELFLQVVGSTHKFEDLIESCKRGLCLSDLPLQDYKSLMDTQATGRLSWVIDILRRLKLIRLVTDGHEEDADITPHAILTHAMEVKPYIEEPLSRVPLSLGVSSSDLRPRIRHDFILSNKEAVDIYWKTLEYCYATADPTAAVHAFPGSAVQEVFLYRSWASVRVMTADQRSELLKRVLKGDPNRKISFADCVKIARDLNLTLEQVLRVSNDKRQSRLHRFQSDFIVNEQELQPETINCRSASRKRKKYLKEKSSKHIKSVNGQSGRRKMPSLSESNGQYTEEENPITTHTGDQDVHLQECEEDTHAQSAEELRTNGEDQEDNYDYISQCAFLKQKPTRQPKFLWTETSDRQLVIQYVRYRAALGAKYYRTGWANLPDLPAPPETCRRRMAFLRSNQTVRRAVTRLCNLLGERYAKHLDKSKEKELFNHDDSGHIVQNSSIEECVGRNFPTCLEKNLESDFENQRWDDFEDQNVRGVLDEVLRYIRIAKLEGYKRAGPSPEKEWPDRNLDAQECDFQELDFIPSTSTTAQEMPNKVGKRQRRSRCHRLPGKFLKLLNEGISVSRRAYESLAVANAVELLKLVFLSTSTAPEVPTLLAETLRRYSEHDLFAAFNYLREKKFMVGGNGSQPFVLSQQFLQSVSSSPFPINTGKRASKFASWLCEREKALTEEGIHLNADLQCGEVFHLLALVSSGELFMSPCLPDEGVGEVEEKRSSKHKSYEDELFSGDQVKKATSLLMNDGGECVSRREKGFPGIKVSLIRATISRADAVELLKNEKIGTSSSRFDESDQSICCASGISDSLSLSDQLNSSNISSSTAPISGTVYGSSWKAMTSYGEYLMSSLSDEERVGPLYPELFQTVHSTIRKSGDQGLSMQEVSQFAAIEGGMMAELVIDVLQVFGLAVKVNAYDHVHVVDASFHSKYFLSSADGRYRDLKPSPQMKSPRISDDNYLNLPKEYVKNAETSMDLDVHKVTILNLPEEVSQPSGEAQPCIENVRIEDNIQVEVVSSEGIKESKNLKCMASGDTHSHSFRPILPWINGDGTTNTIVYKGLSRRVQGIVMQNPGILEDDLIHRMDTLNPQNCRKLLELMVLDNHLIVRKMYQTTSSGPPATLQSLFGSSFKKPDPICRDHFFANPMSTSLL
ncbi:B-block binding subunit of TFIIIC [Macleaya cordata]|uniref:B-block binding subunit of TFIIIC n=1 Tax=Macleaya cordata TaxID=56857 RepID=A0A200QSD6_MACCD|nr:B-block binding subunit of TFIIIC [Macleaya cordata]